LYTLSDPLQQPLQSRIFRGTNLFVQHDYRGEFFPQTMGFVMLVPLFCSKGFPFVPQKGRTGEENRSFLYGAKLMKIPAE
jgi:hypothetical protein